MLNLVNVIKKYWFDFLQLFFPDVCLICGEKLIRQEEYVCLKCLYDLPRTGFSKDKGNKVEQILWGRAEIENAASFFFYRKGSRYQKLIHQMKYKGLKELGFVFGRLLGYELSEANRFSDIDYLIPVPLHPKRLKKRGFNQSEWIAKGIKSAMNIPINNTCLKRNVFTSTQTRKTKFERWKNVESIFGLNNFDLLKNKHVLLIDDVITTGSTLEACATALKKISGIKISIATLGYADY